MSGLLVIISAPSGAGKTTLIQRLLADDPNCTFSVSHTTRAPRTGEKNGCDYTFVSDAEFDRMVSAGEFAEWAVVHDHRYGTAMAEVERLTSAGRDVVFDVDTQGGRALMRRFRNAVSIFILPPSMAEVKKRLLLRGTDDEATIALRLHNARVEIAIANEYRFAVVNDDLEAACKDIKTILEAARLSTRAAAVKIQSLLCEDIESKEVQLV